MKVEDLNGEEEQYFEDWLSHCLSEGSKEKQKEIKQAIREVIKQDRISEIEEAVSMEQDSRIDVKEVVNDKLTMIYKYLTQGKKQEGKEILTRLKSQLAGMLDGDESFYLLAKKDIGYLEKL